MRACACVSVRACVRAFRCVCVCVRARLRSFERSFVRFARVRVYACVFCLCAYVRARARARGAFLAHVRACLRALRFFVLLLLLLLLLCVCVCVCACVCRLLGARLAVDAQLHHPLRPLPQRPV